MTLSQPLPPSPDSAVEGKFGAPAHIVRWLAAALILVLCVTGIFILARFHANALDGAERNLSSTAHTLAEHGDGAMQGADLVLDAVERFAVARGTRDAASFGSIMATYDMNRAMRDRMVGLPQIAALFAISMDGRLINSTRMWPAADISVTDRDYYKTMLAADAPRVLVTSPMLAPGDGAPTFFIVRKLLDPQGQPMGLLVAALKIAYFEEFYSSVSESQFAVVVLLRDDGTILARFPRADTVGKNLRGMDVIQPSQMSVTIRAPSPMDGTAQLKVVNRLRSHPMAILMSRPEASVFQDWWRMAGILALVTVGCALAIIAATLLVIRQWKHQEALGRERESRALAETALMRERELSAEAESRAKSGFLAQMSHEIRTPMNGVIGLAGSLLDTPLNQSQKHMIAAIRDSGDSLLRILNDILDFSKLEAGRMPLESVAFSPETLTHNMLSLMGPRATAKGLLFDATSDESLPPAVLGDAGRLRQVLLNLVSNAVKFTESGSVTIRAHSSARGEEKATIVWTISDTGIGIPRERLGGLFGDFVQADASISRRFGGSGLGLAISKRLIEQMDGSITVDSRPGIGSTFEVTVSLPVTSREPYQPVGLADSAEAFRAQSRRLGRPVRILFAEDNPTNQFVALQLLRGFDVQIDMANDGLEAVHAASRFRYDVICMDMRMPEMDGLAATRAIRARGGDLSRVPILALTANAFPEDVTACFGAGMTGFIAKPVRKETLLGELVKALATIDPENVPAGCQVAETPPELVSAHRAFDRVDFARLNEEIGADVAVQILAMFEAETRARLRLMADSDLSRGALSREMHSLKGAAATACAPVLSDLASRLEQRLKEKPGLDSDDLTKLHTEFAAWCGEAALVSPAG